jgi:plastocyanin
MRLLQLSRISLIASMNAAVVLSGCSGPNSGPVPPISSGVPQSSAFRSPGTLRFPSGTTWQVQAGSGRRDGALQALAMAPDVVTINEGDRITWTIGGKFHTVTFLGRFVLPPANPAVPQGGSIFNGSDFVSSGILAPGKHYTLTFTRAGTYVYFCALNFPEMSGTVVVQRRGSALPRPQGFYTGVGNSELNLLLRQAMSSVRSIPFPVGGSTVAAGVSPGTPDGTHANANVLRFLDGDRLNLTSVTIPVNSTVTWVNLSNNDVHTVTIPPPGQPLPNINPFTPGTPHATYDGVALVNTGPFGNASFKLPSNTVTVKFTKRGTYFYGCLLHHQFGMEGTVIVK